MIYLTPDDYEKAAANGIKKNTVYARVYLNGWSKERAVTEAPRPARTTPALRRQARDKDVPLTTLRERLRKGWSEQEALYGKQA